MDLVLKVLPKLYRPFQRIWDVIGTSSEMDVVKETYRRIEPMNFSRGFLEALPLKYPLHLGVLPVRGVFWSDWGSEQRVVSVLGRQII